MRDLRTSGRPADQGFEVNVHIRARSGPGENGIDILRWRGFRNIFEALEHGEQDGRTKIRIVAEAEINDRRWTPGQSHAQADSALKIAETELPPPGVAEEAKGAVFVVRFCPLKDQGLLRSGCPHQEFGRFPS